MLMCFLSWNETIHRADLALLEAEVQDRRDSEPEEFAIHYYARKGDPANVRRLIKQFGVSVDMLTTDFQTPLHIAIFNNRSVVVKRLLHYKPNLYYVNPSGYTPLRLAIYLKHYEIAHMLMMAMTDTPRRSLGSPSRTLAPKRVTVLPARVATPKRVTVLPARVAVSLESSEIASPATKRETASTDSSGIDPTDVRDFFRTFFFASSRVHHASIRMIIPPAPDVPAEKAPSPKPASEGRFSFVTHILTGRPGSASKAILTEKAPSPTAAGTIGRFSFATGMEDMVRQNASRRLLENRPSVYGINPLYDSKYKPLSTSKR